jgi:hypothetical protein
MYGEGSSFGPFFDWRSDRLRLLDKIATSTSLSILEFQFHKYSTRDVGAHLGLTPRRYQFGETDVQGCISRCGDELARTALYEAAHSLLIRSTKWSTLRVGHEHRQAPEHGARPCRGGSQVGGHFAPYVGRRQRIPLGQAGRRIGSSRMTAA